MAKHINYPLNIRLYSDATHDKKSSIYVFRIYLSFEEKEKNNMKINPLATLYTFREGIVTQKVFIFPS